MERTLQTGGDPDTPENLSHKLLTSKTGFPLESFQDTQETAWCRKPMPSTRKSVHNMRNYMRLHEAASFDVPCTQRHGQHPGSTSQNSPSEALSAPCRHARRHDAHAAAACTATACACWPTAPPGLLATISLSLPSRARALLVFPLQSQPRRHRMPLSKRTRACAQPRPWLDARMQAHSLTSPVRAANTQPARAAAARSDRAPGGAQRARTCSYNSEEGASRAAGGGGRLAERPCSGTKRTGIRSSSARRPSGPLSTRLRTWRGRNVRDGGAAGAAACLPPSCTRPRAGPPGRHPASGATGRAHGRERRAPAGRGALGGTCMSSLGPPTGTTIRPLGFMLSASTLTCRHGRVRARERQPEAGRWRYASHLLVTHAFPCRGAAEAHDV